MIKMAINRLSLINQHVPIRFCGAEGFEFKYSITANEKGYIVRQTVKNVSDRTLRLQELKSELYGILLEKIRGKITITVMKMLGLFVL